MRRKQRGGYDLAIPTTGWSSYLLIYAEGSGAVSFPFTDVADDAYYYDAVKWAVDKGITEGSSKTTFSPGVICTRAQAVTFLWRAMGSPEPTGTQCPFLDVAPGAYYDKAVLWATEKGITVGTSATAFSPDMTVDRNQTVTFLWRMAGEPAATGMSTFADVANNAYYAAAVRWAVEQGITQGTGGNSFSPLAPCDRAQMVTFLYRHMEPAPSAPKK